jgi:hypothetical protein
MFPVYLCFVSGNTNGDFYVLVIFLFVLESKKKSDYHYEILLNELSPGT